MERTVQEARRDEKGRIERVKWKRSSRKTGEGGRREDRVSEIERIVQEEPGREEEGRIESGKWKGSSRKTRGGRKKGG